MKTKLFFLFTLLASLASAQTVSLRVSWDPVNDPRLAGYRIYYGGVSHAYTNVSTFGLVTNVTISGFTPGATYYFADTTFTTNGFGSDYSAEVVYTVPNPVPVITVQPVGSTNNAGSTTTLSVTATGTSLAYQWFKNGAVINGATSATLNLSNLSWSDAASYAVNVSSAGGTVASSAAVVVVKPPVPSGLTVSGQ